MPYKYGMEQTLDRKISENLKYEIEHCGKKKSEIARALGIAPSTLSQYCSGRAQPTLATLSKLCNIMGVSADEILEIKK